MPLLTVILIGIGLSFDAVAVAMAEGMGMKRLHLRSMVRTALFFGFFQMLMPMVGWLAGVGLRNFISGVDHWIAFALLAAVGLKMIFEAFCQEKDKQENDAKGLLVVLTLSLATSIDALAVGLSFSFLGVRIVTPALIIGVITFSLSFLGGFIGYRFGSFFGKKIEIAGGLILIAIGLKILFEHLQIL